MDRNIRQRQVARKTRRLLTSEDEQFQPITKDELLEVIEQAARDGVTELDLSGRDLTELPPEIGQLVDLTRLDLSDNQLTKLPPEIGRLVNLTRLYLSFNQLTAVPSEIERLVNLTQLYLSFNQLTAVPSEIGKLVKLNELDLSSNQLTTLPPEIGKLTNLTTLDLSENHLTILPLEICNLINLQKLFVKSNLLESLHPEIALLNKLTWLSLGGNRFATYPTAVNQLVNLHHLFLWGTGMVTIPSDIMQLTKMTFLSLHSSQLRTLPPEIGYLTDLMTLDLHNNQLTTLPIEIGNLTNLETLHLDDNPLKSPPPEIIEQGAQAVVAYMRERLNGSEQQWVSKLVVVGEGGVGKTSLLKALRGETFSTQESTTHGIQLGALPVAHPVEPDVTMQLNTWDFGGQEIYHATHQFFLTNRSLFLVAWNARHGFEQGKLYYWLDTIQSRAPDSPVLLVATHTDQRDADLPLSELRAKYPQIIGQCEISSLTGAGIETLRATIADAAAGLPLMGELWPTTWLHATEAIRARPEKHIRPSQLWAIMAEHKVVEPSATVLARWLHELGELLYFRESDELNEIVILKPQWVTEYISKVLESDEVIEQAGVFTRAHMDTLWHDLDPAMREHFLRLMERFDLSYRTLENREISLVVERLPLDQPDYAALWESARESGDCTEIAMRFQLNTIPAGIPTWFIARSHRFTTHTHWRSGAVFAYEPEQQHLALVQAFPHERYIQLTVRGPYPQNFFALLKDGIEVTLARFPGLQITRLIPCPGHDDQPCRQEFEYEQLLKRVKKKPMIECPESLEDVSVNQLLFGLHWSTQDAVLQRLDELDSAEVERHAATLNAIENLTALAQREFTNAFRREQARIESHCPNIFVLRPRDQEGWRTFVQGVRKTLAGQTIDLQLYCQQPGCWHPTTTGGSYEIDEPAKWLSATTPYLRRMFSVLKYAAPLVGPWVGLIDPTNYEQQFKTDIAVMDAMVKKLPDLKHDDQHDLAEAAGRADDPERIEGAALRSLRQLLEEKDAAQGWGGLKKVLTPEGHYLWLCEHHAALYK